MVLFNCYIDYGDNGVPDLQGKDGQGRDPQSRVGEAGRPVRLADFIAYPYRGTPRICQ